MRFFFTAVSHQEQHIRVLINEFLPWPVGLVGALFCASEGRRFDSQSGTYLGCGFNP